MEPRPSENEGKEELTKAEEGEIVPADLLPPSLMDDDVTHNELEAQEEGSAPAATSSINPAKNPATTTPASFHQPKKEPINKCWTHFTEDFIHHGIRQFNVKLAVLAARYPKRCISLITVLSFGLVIVGFMTNFQILYSHSDIFTPLGSKSYVHQKWIDDRSNFTVYEEFMFMIHADGEDVMNTDAIRRLFHVLDTVRNTSGYDEICLQSDYLNVKNEPTCWIWSPTNFWSHNVTLFESQVHSDEDVQRQLSAPRFPDDTPVFQESLFGRFETTNRTFVYNAFIDQAFQYPHAHPYLTYVPTLFVIIGLPNIDDTWPFEETVLEQLVGIRDYWLEQSPQDNPHNLQLEFFSSYGYELEYERALNNDIPLVPIIFFIMIGFTCYIFHSYGAAQPGSPTRATVGLASVATIGMAMVRYVTLRV